MATDSDNDFSLPQPPPPRPAARRDAIEAALRKFDGTEDAAHKQPTRTWWVSHQRQIGALATAAIIAVVSIPVALTIWEDQPRPAAPQASAPARVQPKPLPPAVADSAPQPAQTQDTEVAEVPRSKLPLEPHEEKTSVASIAEERKTANEAPPLEVAAAPPPAAPPPPPPAPAPQRDDSADQAEAQSVMVTGSRIRQPELSSPHGAAAAERAVAEAANPISASDVYRKFLPRLQAAIRSENRRAVSALIAFPLRVNAAGGTRIYRDRKSVEDDFYRIFTPRVRAAILGQKADRLFTNSQGAMVGNGEVWFDQSCSNASCSPPGPVRIKAINP